MKVDDKMTEGEKMVWAAAFALAYSDAVAKGFGYADPKAVTTDCARTAWRTVVALRFGVDLVAVTPEGDGMWLSMIGMNRSAEGTLYP